MYIAAGIWATPDHNMELTHLLWPTYFSMALDKAIKIYFIFTGTKKAIEN
jgi:hypothetical protein